MTTHLRVSAYYNDEHPQKMVERLGITYQHSTPQSIADQWWFWNCENIPDPLPEHFSILECKDPFEMVGFGLSKEDAEKIRDYVSQQSLPINTKKMEEQTIIPAIAFHTVTITEHDMKALERIKHYFGGKDKSPLEHIAYDVLDRILNASRYQKNTLKQ